MNTRVKNEGFMRDRHTRDERLRQQTSAHQYKREGSAELMEDACGDWWDGILALHVVLGPSHEEVNLWNVACELGPELTLLRG